MTIPTIELRAIRVNHSCSEETYCYSATLYVDGERWGEVHNHGQGGADEFHPTGPRSYADIRALDALLKLEGPKHEGHGYSLDDCLELRCGDLVTAHIREDEVRRALRSKLLYTKPGTKGLFQASLKSKGRVWTVDQILASYDRQGFAVETVLNHLPFPEAVALYYSTAEVG